MDGCDFLPVRFHFNGEFLRNSNGLFYVGGTQAMSYIDRDKLSLPEVVGHLHDHFNVKEGTNVALAISRERHEFRLESFG
jgi:alpha-galactosidase